MALCGLMKDDEIIKNAWLGSNRLSPTSIEYKSLQQAIELTRYDEKRGKIILSKRINDLLDKRSKMGKELRKNIIKEFL